MDRNQIVQTLRARWVFSVSAPPIDGGYVTLRGDRIVSVGKRSDSPARDLGDVAILPGFVNAHTHLEFSDLAEPLGQPGMPFAEWIALVVAQRRTQSTGVETAIGLGLRETQAAGTVALGEIANADWRSAAQAMPHWPAHLTMFFEAIGPTPARCLQSEQEVEAFVNVDRNKDSRPLCLGLSPHAPYTVYGRQLESLVALAGARGLPLAMHLAESPEEMQLLHSGTGPFRELLARVGAWDPRFNVGYRTAREYLERLSAAPRALVVHGNYLSAADHAFLAAQRETMSLVYCPRTHDFFGHARYPLSEALAAGVNVALGTDSRASNPDLSLFEEVRFVAARHCDVRPSEVLRLGTQAGAQALGLADFGVLEAGKAAHLAIVSIPDAAPVDPHELLFAPHARVTQTWIAGQMAYCGSPGMG